MKAIVFGGGKIARGFIGHLLYLSQIPFVVVDVNEQLVTQLNRSAKYFVNIMGNEDKSTDVRGFSALLLTDVQDIAAAWVDAEVAFVSVGGKNLVSLGRSIAAAFRMRCDQAEWNSPFNLIVCENWKEPAAVLREAIRANLSDRYLSLFDEWIGITEAVVMRSGVEPPLELLKKDPLCVCVSNYWELPIDRSQWKGEPLSIYGLRYIDQFSGFLERKFFTYNAANGTVSYLGYLRNHKLIYEAATDPHIVPILDKVYAETGKALAMKHEISEEEQRSFAMSSKKKLQDTSITDYVERNARDPIRKLGPDDRLIGAAAMAIQYGVTPHALATAAAAALYYDHPDDPAALELRSLREQYGIDHILQTVCKLDVDQPLALLIKDKIQWLREEGWII